MNAAMLAHRVRSQQHRLASFAAAASSYAAATPPTASTVVHPSTGNVAVDDLNTALNTYPLTTSFIWLYHNPAVASGVFTVLSLCGVAPPVELGAAFVLNSTLRRLRVPAIVAVATLVVRAAPTLALVPMSRLVTTPYLLLLGETPTAATAATTMTRQGQHEMTRADRSARGGGGDDTGEVLAAGNLATPAHPPLSLGVLSSSEKCDATSPAEAAAVATPTAAASTSPPSESTPSLLTRARSLLSTALTALHPTRGAVGVWGSSVIDRFGLAFYISARGVSSLNLLAIYAALSYGVDFGPLVVWLGCGVWGYWGLCYR